MRSTAALLIGVTLLAATPVQAQTMVRWEQVERAWRAGVPIESTEPAAPQPMMHASTLPSWRRIAPRPYRSSSDGMSVPLVARPAPVAAIRSAVPQPQVSGLVRRARETHLHHTPRVAPESQQHQVTRPFEP